MECRTSMRVGLRRHWTEKFWWRCRSSLAAGISGRARCSRKLFTQRQTPLIRLLLWIGTKRKPRGAGCIRMLSATRLGVTSGVRHRSHGVDRGGAAHSTRVNQTRPSGPIKDHACLGCSHCRRSLKAHCGWRRGPTVASQHRCPAYELGSGDLSTCKETLISTRRCLNDLAAS